MGLREELAKREAEKAAANKKPSMYPQGSSAEHGNGNGNGNGTSSTMGMLNAIRTDHKQKFERERVPRTSQTELILASNEPKLFRLENKNAERYVEVLKEIGAYKALLEKKPDFDLSYFEIDMSGADKRVLNILPNYMDKHIAIVSPHQKNMDLLRSNYSFMKPMLSAILDGPAKGTIAALTPYEPLFGGLESGLEKLIKQLNLGATQIVEEQYFKVKLSLETPSKAIQRLTDLKKKSEEILKEGGVTNILNYDLEDQIVAEAKSLGEIYDNVPTFVLGAGDSVIIQDIFPLIINVSSYKYSNADMDVYSFFSSKYMFIYFNKDKEKKQDRDAVIVTDKYVLIDGNSPFALLTYLHANNLIDYNLDPKYIKQLMAEMDSEELAAMNKTQSLDLTSDLTSLMSTKPKKAPERSKLYNNLKQLLEDIEDGEVTNEKEYMKTQTSMEVRLALLFPKQNDRLIYEMLTKISGEHMLMDYTWNTSVFKQEFTDLPTAEKKKTVKMLLSQIKYEDQYNVDVNQWLSDNYKPLCDELGVNFVKKEVQR